MSSTPPGWHPDPQGRHQYRFWDGTIWTDQVSDNGVVNTDPLNAAPAPSDAGPTGGEAGGTQQSDANDTGFGGATGATAGSATGGPPPVSGGPPPGSPILPDLDTPPAPESSSKLPLVIVGIVVLVGVLIAGFLLLRGGGGGGTADGDYRLTVKQGQVTIRKVKLKAGEALYVRVKGKHLRRALAIDASAYKDYIDNKFINTDSSNQLSRFDGRGFYSDDKDLSKQLSGFDTGSAKFRYPGFGTDVLMLRSFIGGQHSQPFRGDSQSVVAPIGGTYFIAFRSTNGDQQASLSLRTAANPGVKKNLDTSQYADVYSDSFYSDFYSEATDQVDTARS